MNLFQLARSQEEFRVVALIDNVCAFDIESARMAGVDVQRLLVAQPDNAEQSADIVETLARCGAVDTIAVLGGMRYPADRIDAIRAVAARTGTSIREC